MWSRFTALWTDSMAFRISAAVVIVGLIKLFA